MTMYLNKFDFLNLAVGVNSAAEVYFQKPLDSLRIEEAAMLVGMAKNPALFNPVRRPEKPWDVEMWFWDRCRNMGKLQKHNTIP